ncbi:hypothetical protein Bca4012_018646 [Brassica carinata]
MTFVFASSHGFERVAERRRSSRLIQPPWSSSSSSPRHEACSSCSWSSSPQNLREGVQRPADRIKKIFHMELRQVIVDFT